MTELVAHSNDLRDLRPFGKLANLRLLDVENNNISDDYVPASLKVLNIRGNPISKSNSTQSIAEYSSFEKFGPLAFGMACEPKAQKRVIRICPTASEASFSDNASAGVGWAPERGTF